MIIDVKICNGQYFVELIFANILKVKIINVVVEYVGVKNCKQFLEI